MRWQKRARLAVAAFGIASAVGVYALMGERTQPTPAVAPVRLDPKAVLESRGNILQQVRGTRQDYIIEAEQQLTYEGGASKLVGIKVTVKNRAGRDYVITAREAQAGEGEQELRLTGAVRLEATDGFQITTEEAFFSEQDGTVRAPEAFAFSRGRMSGQGVGMAYDKNNDIIEIREQAAVTNLAIRHPKEMRQRISRAEPSDRRLRYHGQVGRDDWYRHRHIQPAGHADSKEGRVIAHVRLDAVDRRHHVLPAAEQHGIVVGEHGGHRA